MNYLYRILIIITTAFVLVVSANDASAAKKKKTRRSENVVPAAVILGILPFKNNASPDYQWLANGISDTLIAKYSGGKGVKLVEREKLSAITDETADSELATKLGTDFILAGSYTVANEKIRISARLISSETAEIYRDSSHTVTGRIDDIFSLQTQLAKEIAEECSLTISKGRLSYQEGNTIDAHRAFNNGKALYYRAFKKSGETSNETFKEALVLFTEAQKLNQGDFFAEAHTWEGRVYQALADTATKPASRKKILAKQIKKFRADAAKAAPALYDLGDALQSAKQYKKAIKAYDDYLEWIADGSKPLINQNEARRPSVLKLESYTDSLKTFYDLRFGIIDGSQVLYLQKSARARYELISYNPQTNETKWKTELKGTGRQRYYAGAQASVTIAATDELLFLFVDDIIFMVDRKDGAIKGKSPSFKTSRKYSYGDRMIYLDPDSKTGILVGAHLDQYPRKRVRRFAYHFSYDSSRIKTKELYKGDWYGGHANKTMQYFRSTEENGNVYFYDRFLELGKQTIAFTIKDGKEVKSDKEVKHWDSFARTPKVFTGDNTYFSISDQKLQKFDENTDELLWQYKLQKSPRFIGIFKDNPLIYEYMDCTYTLYNSKAESRKVSNHAKALLNKAVCLIECEKYSDALRSLKMALTIDFSQREAYYWLGVTYSHLAKTEQNLLYALISYDRYSNEAIDDAERSKEVYDYLRKYGGILKKTTFKKKSFIMCSPTKGTTSVAPYLNGYCARFGFNLYSHDMNTISDIKNHVRFFDDRYTYSCTGSTVRVSDYINEGAVAEIYCDEEVLAWWVDCKKILILSGADDSKELAYYDAESGDSLWSISLEGKLAKATAYKLFSQKGLVLIVTDNDMGKANHMAVVDAKTNAVLWNKRVAANLVFPHGTNSVKKTDLTSILFTGDNVFYNGAFSGKVLRIDARSGKTITEKTSANIVGFREYIADGVVAFRHMNLQCTCHGNIKKEHDTFPENIQTHHLRDELRHKKENYARSSKRKTSPLTHGSLSQTRDIRSWVQTTDKHVVVASAGYAHFTQINTENGKIAKSFYLPFRYPVNLFRDENHLYASSAREYHSAGKVITNVYQFESTKLPENLKAWSMFNNPAELNIDE